MAQVIRRVKESIVLKLVLASVIGLALVMLVGSLIEYRVNSKLWHENHERIVTLNTQLLELSLPGALWNYQDELVDGVLKSVVNIPEVLAIYLKEDGEISKGFLQSASSDIIESTDIPEGYQFLTKELFIKEAGNAPIAELIIVVSEDQLHSILGDVRTMNVIRTLVIALILSLAILVLVRQLIYKPIEHLTMALNNLNSSEGDLTKRIQMKTNDEMGRLGQLFNDFLEKLQGAVGNIGEIAKEMNDSAASLAKLSHKSSELVNSQQQEVEQIAAAANQSSAASEEVAVSTKISLDAASDASQGVNNARTTMHELVEVNSNLDGAIKTANDAMESLNADVAEIGVVLEVIRGIAEQTNLLALNAAIEAARAGEQGRGFAVVADEVRALAAKTADSTSEIHEMIGKLQNGAAAGMEATSKGLEVSSCTVKQVEEAGQALETIFEAIEKINDMSAQIATATQQQAAVTSEISSNAASLSHVSAQSAEGSSDSADIAELVSDQIARLKKAIVQFRY